MIFSSPDIVKARGTAHSNQVREYHLTSEGIRLTEVYVGAGGVLTGTARMAQEARERADQKVRQQKIEHRKRELERKRKALDLRVAQLQAEFETEKVETEYLIQQEELQEQELEAEKARMADNRAGSALKTEPSGKKQNRNNKKKKKNKATMQCRPALPAKCGT